MPTVVRTYDTCLLFLSSKNPDDTELDDALQNVVSINGNIDACAYIPLYVNNQ